MTVVADRDMATSWTDERVLERTESAVTADPGHTAAGWRWTYLAPWFAVSAVSAYVRCVAAEVHRSARTARSY